MLVLSTQYLKPHFRRVCFNKKVASLAGLFSTVCRIWSHDQTMIEFYTNVPAQTDYKVSLYHNIRADIYLLEIHLCLMDQSFKFYQTNFWSLKTPSWKSGPFQFFASPPMLLALIEVANGPQPQSTACRYQFSCFVLYPITAWPCRGWFTYRVVDSCFKIRKPMVTDDKSMFISSRPSFLVLFKSFSL